MFLFQIFVMVINAFNIHWCTPYNTYPLKGLNRSGLIQRAEHGLSTFVQDMSIYHGRADILPAV